MITWSDNYIMGIEQFDHEHKQLFHLSQQILSKMRISNRNSPDTHLFVIRESLTYINSYFERHAREEEAYMRSIGYEGYALHKMLHDDFQNSQLARYRQIMESGQCREADVWDFIGSGVGWLLEHIATADMAIVGRGILSQSPLPRMDHTALEQEINLLFASTLNIGANAKIASIQYAGEDYGKAIYQKMLYQTDQGQVTVISGIERTFLLDVAHMLYGETMEDEVDLILSTLQSFGAHFWGSLGRRFAGNYNQISVKETCLLPAGMVREELKRLHPTISLLFTSDMGRFSVSSNHVSSSMSI